MSESTLGRTVVLLDGGVGQELYRRSTRPASPLWSVQVMMDEPELVEAVHLDFIEAGARIITLNTYTATPHRLAREGVAETFDALHAAAAAAVLINCSSPEAVAAALPALATAGVPFGAYANGFVFVGALQPGGTVDVLEARDDLDPPTYAGHAMAWVGAGAAIVGGCCEIGPAHIAALGHRLAAEGYRSGAVLSR